MLLFISSPVDGLLCLLHSRCIIMIVIIAVMIAVTGTAMTTDIPVTTDEDKPIQYKL